MIPEKQVEARGQQLDDAADELFNIRALPDEFPDLSETQKWLAILRQLSMKASALLEAWEGTLEDLEQPSMTAAFSWRDAPNADCLRECERIAETIEEAR